MEPPQKTENRDEKINEIKGQVNTVSEIVYENFDKLMARELRLDSIQRRSELLNAASENFKLTARKSKREMWWINAKWKIISSITGVVVILILLFVILKGVGVI